MSLGVVAHSPEVVAVRALNPEKTVVELGRKADGVLGAAVVSLFLDAAEVLGLVVDLVNGVEDATPGFLLELLDALTG